LLYIFRVGNFSIEFEEDTIFFYNMAGIGDRLVKFPGKYGIYGENYFIFLPALC